jgi:large subunit ribosomal protein L6
MSRIGKKIIPVPDKVKVSVKDDVFLAEGPLGKEQVKIHPMVKLALADKVVKVERGDDNADARRIQGLVRSLVANAVDGVATGFKKELDINGVGYRAELKGNSLNLTLGFSHPVNYSIPTGIKVAVDKQTHLVISGSNKDLVGRVSADIRRFRPPEPYKGKGIKYSDETIIRKVGKAAGGK